MVHKEDSTVAVRDHDHAKSFEIPMSDMPDELAEWFQAVLPEDAFRHGREVNDDGESWVDLMYLVEDRQTPVSDDHLLALQLGALLREIEWRDNGGLRSFDGGKTFRGFQSCMFCLAARQEGHAPHCRGVKYGVYPAPPPTVDLGVGPFDLRGRLLLVNGEPAAPIPGDLETVRSLVRSANDAMRRSLHR